MLVLWTGSFFYSYRNSVDTPKFETLGEDVINVFAGKQGAWEALQSNRMYPQYLLSGLAIGGVKRVFGPDYRHAFVVINILLFGLTIVFVFQTWFELRPDFIDGSVAMTVAGLAVLFSIPDVPLWVYWTLSDNMFLTVMSLYGLFLVRAVTRRDKASWGGAILVCVLGFIVRPTAIMMPVVLLMALLFVLVGGRKKRAWLGPSIILFAGIGAFVVGPWLVSLQIQGVNVRDYMPTFLASHFSQSVYIYLQGRVISDQPDTYIANVQSVWDVIYITTLRFFYYFVPIKTTYSCIHNVVNGIAWPVLVTMMYIGWKHLTQKNLVSYNAAWCLVIMAYCYGLLHAVTIVSYEWRYQLPAMVPAWVLAGIGARVVYGHFRSHAA